MSGFVTIELTRAAELVRSIERQRSFYDESDCSKRSRLQWVSAMVNPWSARNDCIGRDRCACGGTRERASAARANLTHAPCRVATSASGTSGGWHISANSAALGLATRCNDSRSTLISPKRCVYPSAHSKLSQAVQYR